MRAKRTILIGGLTTAVFAAGIGFGRYVTTSTPLPSLGEVALAQEAPVGSARPVGTIPPDLMSFADVAEQVTPAVVTVRAEKKPEVRDRRMPEGPFGDDFFRFFQNPPRGDGRQRGMGSGFIVDADGVILTNNHVVDGADKIVVRLSDGRELPAEVVGTDPKTDIAVLRVEAKGLRAAELGDDRRLRVGEWVLAIGSPLGPQYEHSVTAGIISAKGRAGLGLADYEDYLQTDAAINPGNSGGPLVNLRGEVVGINSAIASRTGGYQGLSFAIPMTMARDIMDQLLAHGKVTRAWLGVSIQDVTPDIAAGLKLDKDSGILISDVVAGSPASRAGLEDGDVIVSLDGKPTGPMQEFRNRIARSKPGTRVELGVLRDDKERTFDVTLEEMADEQVARGGSPGQEDAPEGELGIEITNVTPAVAQQYGLDEGTHGVLVTNVEPGSAAAEAGLRPGDVLRSVNRKRVTNVRELKAALERVPSKDPVVLQVAREDRTFYVSVTRDS